MLISIYPNPDEPDDSPQTDREGAKRSMWQRPSIPQACLRNGKAATESTWHVRMPRGGRLAMRRWRS